jgi:flavin reductase (DIM6/NTAB) family NADH-FMN oxidoreductase RutF
MKTFILSELSNPSRHHLMLSAVGPRPIAFASTIDKKGQVNLSPFSFFNLFSTNPPIAVFSVSRRGYDGSMKDTHLNVLEVPEVAINIVNFDMVQQTSLSSNEYPRDVNEFIKAGFSMAACDSIKPPYVAEAPVVLECKVQQVMPLGGEGASGNMIICAVDRMHVKEHLLDDQGRLDTTKIDLVGRMGGNWYCRAFGEALFEVSKPGRVTAIGIDALPEHVRQSEILSANDLGILGSATNIPAVKDLEKIALLPDMEAILKTKKSFAEKKLLLHQQIKTKIAIGEPDIALAIAFWADTIL